MFDVRCSMFDVRRFHKSVRWLALGFVAAQLSIGARADIYVADWTSGAGGPDGKIGLYTDSGAAINPSLVPGLSQPHFFATDPNGLIYVTSFSHGSGVGVYDRSGTAINDSLITGLD